MKLSPLRFDQIIAWIFESIMSTITFDKISDSYDRINKYIHKTPVLTNSTISNLTQNKTLYFKCEFLQKTGSFKARGACNATILALETGKYNGVCTHSSGNHAQALAMAAKSIGSLEAHIVMPLNSPQCKREGVIGYGANVYYCESTQEAREKMSKEISESTGSLFIHPSEDINVICGQGTVAIEFLSQVPDLDIIIVPVGGGGLISGIATAAKAIKPSIVIIGAEPEEANDAFRSKTSNQWIKNDKPPITIADGLKTSLGPNTWPIVNSLVDEVITVSEDEIKHALKLVWERMKCLIEPSAAVGVAVATNRKFLDKYTNPANVGIVLCGGNVDIKEIANLIY